MNGLKSDLRHLEYSFTLHSQVAAERAYHLFKSHQALKKDGLFKSIQLLEGVRECFSYKTKNDKDEEITKYHEEGFTETTGSISLVFDPRYEEDVWTLLDTYKRDILHEHKDSKVPLRIKIRHVDEQKIEF